MQVGTISDAGCAPPQFLNLHPSPTSYAFSFNLNSCILTVPHLLPVTSLFSFISHECCPVKAAAVPYLIGAHRLKYTIRKFREVNILDNERSGSVDKFFSYLPFPTQGQLWDTIYITSQRWDPMGWAINYTGSHLDSSPSLCAFLTLVPHSCYLRLHFLIKWHRSLLPKLLFSWELRSAKTVIIVVIIIITL